MDIKRESIFACAMRGFVKSCAFVFGIAFSIFIIFVVIGAIIGSLSKISGNISLPNKSEMTVSPDADWNCKLLPHTTPVLLRIDVEGIIGLGKLKGKNFKDMLVDSREGSLANNRVKGILLYVNTPGGSASDSSTIYHLVKQYKETYKVPVYAFVDGLCASGGMYVSSAADQIWATSNSVVGSVGVRIGPAFNVSEAMQKIGVQSVTLTEGKNKDALNPFRPWKSGEEDAIKVILAKEYEIFVDVVTQNRKELSKEKLIQEYGANVFLAQEAKQLGYIDNGNAHYDQALAALAIEAGIKRGEKYQVILVEPYKSIFSELANNNTALFSGKLTHVFPTGSHTTSEMGGQILYLYQP